MGHLKSFMANGLTIKPAKQLDIVGQNEGTCQDSVQEEPYLHISRQVKNAVDCLIYIIDFGQLQPQFQDYSRSQDWLVKFYCNIIGQNPHLLNFSQLCVEFLLCHIGVLDV